MLADELAVILVRCYHKYLKPFFFSSFGHRSYNVVGLIALDHQDREAHCLTDFAQWFQCVYHQLRRLLTCTFVVRVHFVSEGASWRIEGYCEMCWLFLFDKFEDIFCESEQNGHIRTFGVDHRMPQECIVHLENQCVSVYQKESFVHNRLD